MDLGEEESGPRRVRDSSLVSRKLLNIWLDEPQYQDSTRMALLENWESQLIQCLRRKPLHPVFIALQETIKRFDLPPDLF